MVKSLFPVKIKSKSQFPEKIKSKSQFPVIGLAPPSPNEAQIRFKGGKIDSSGEYAPLGVTLEKSFRIGCVI